MLDKYLNNCELLDITLSPTSGLTFNLVDESSAEESENNPYTVALGIYNESSTDSDDTIIVQIRKSEIPLTNGAFSLSNIFIF